MSSNLLSGNIPVTFGNLSNLFELRLYNDSFTFAGMELIAQKFSFASYSPQANILISRQGDQLSVSAGGTLSNDTFHWYKNNALIATINGDSTYTVTSTGTYSVAVTNSIATQLTLYSDTIDITSLPVNWLSFTATNTGKSVLFNWQTANELNNNYFSVERSLNGINFSEIAQVKSKGNSTQPQQYSFEDFNYVNGQNYYRLKQVDNDGKFSYSKIVSVDFPTATTLKLYPNPVKNMLRLEGLNPSINTIISIVDNSGKMLQQINTLSRSYTFNLQKLSAGNYYLKIEADKKVTTLKFVKE